MTDHMDNRNAILASLREELVGPAPRGTPIETGSRIKFGKPSDSYGPWVQARSGDEILTRVSPAKRYGIGVLYPPGVSLQSELPAGGREDDLAPPTGDEGEPDQLSAVADDSIRRIAEREGRRRGMTADPDDFDLSDANAMRPCVVGVTFFADLPPGSRLVVRVPQTHPQLGTGVNGRYVPMDVQVVREQRAARPEAREGGEAPADDVAAAAAPEPATVRWWLRQPVSGSATFAADAILAADGETVPPESPPDWQGAEGLNLRIQLRARRRGNDRSLITVCLRNDTPGSGRSIHQHCLFQTYFDCTVEAPDGGPHILPYPGRTAEDDVDSEEASLHLIYRRARNFAVGHACAADWDRAEEAEDRVIRVRSECLPVWRAGRVTPDIGWPTQENGLAVPMESLIDLDKSSDGLDAIERVIRSYEEWIERGAAEAERDLDSGQRATARRHLQHCRECAARMKVGLDLMRPPGRVRRAFELANRAIHLQQTAANQVVRTQSFNRRENRLVYSSPLVRPEDWDRSGAWRPFQIAFILMNLESLSNPQSAERSNVELLWFPTGGGKTEAYLGLIAFTLFYLRLDSDAETRSAGAHGVEVLMRYTLRLLTAQQFERASSLICAMEHIRRLHEEELGQGEFTIGIWLGSSTTPNRRKDACDALSDLQRNPKSENPFLLIRCPWCGAEMGPAKHSFGNSGRRGGVTAVPGYERRANTVALVCPDRGCEFAHQLPVYVVDQDIYDVRPSLVIGTVDKFAMLAWRPEARALFGLGEDGTRERHPPGLIVQDELHLISGPLGSMYGLYEPIIEELCTDRRVPQAVPPKIVCSTATIRRHEDQIKALYGRASSSLFPPPGLAADDSFFAQPSTRTVDGRREPEPGTWYVGVHGPGLGSMQTVEVRTLSALLQAPMAMDEEARDPWWTVVTFFNSLRELGTSLSLLQSDIPDYLLTKRYREDHGKGGTRYLRQIKELTSRLSDDEVSRAIAELQVTTTSGRAIPVDVCLASSMIEVGIDISRLSLMAVVGQPKTTAQYIQVTGRIGRKADRPGLVVMMYGHSKPRDRSHFEQFRSYHERLYAAVEPTSVTPFSTPALDRALHAVMAVYARQAASQAVASSPYPYPADVVEACREIMRRRVLSVDEEACEYFDEVFDRRAGQWDRWQRLVWDRTPSGPPPLMLRAGAFALPGEAKYMWQTPQSMRNVDAECRAEVLSMPLNGEGTDGE